MMRPIRQRCADEAATHTKQTGEPALNHQHDAPSIHDIRFANYLALREQFDKKCLDEGHPARGLLNRFADFTGVSPKYLSHVNTRRKNIGDATSNAIEKAFNLPKAWMDTDHSRGTDPTGELEIEFTSLALKLFRESPTEAQALMMRYMADRMMKAAKPMS